MTRQSKGIASIISGALFVIVGIVLIAFTDTPVWVPLAVQAVGAVGSILGLVLVIPDTT